jgi:hypothetical protein
MRWKREFGDSEHGIGFPGLPVLGLVMPRKRRLVAPEVLLTERISNLKENCAAVI